MIPDLSDLAAGLHVVSIPLRVPFRGVTHREMALIEGPVGWGEFAPFLEYDQAEAAHWLEGAIEAAWVGWPEPVRRSIPINATVPAVPAGEVAEVLARFPGCETAKVKVGQAGQTLHEDVMRVAAVREAMGPGAWIRVDANGAWSVAEATDALKALRAYGLEYAEQPCTSVDELKLLRLVIKGSGIGVPIAADESLRRAEDPLAIARAEAADLLVVKAAPLGGVRRALDIVDRAALPAVVSSALETSVGISAGLALAGALPSLFHDCGLGTAALLAGDVVSDPLIATDGTLEVRRVIPEPDLLSKWAAPKERADWWRDRVARCRLTLLERAA